MSLSTFINIYTRYDDFNRNILRMHYFEGFDKALAQFIETCEVDDGNFGQPPRTVIHSSKTSNTGVIAPRGVKGTQKQWKDVQDRLTQELRRVRSFMNILFHYACLAKNRNRKWRACDSL